MFGRISSVQWQDIKARSQSPTQNNYWHSKWEKCWILSKLQNHQPYKSQINFSLKVRRLLQKIKQRLWQCNVLASNVKLMRTLILYTFPLCLWKLDHNRRTCQKSSSPWGWKEQVTTEEVRNSIKKTASSAWWSSHHGEDEDPQIVGLLTYWWQFHRASEKEDRRRVWKILTENVEVRV